MDSSTLTMFGAALVGYLTGSVSGARIVGRLTGAGDLDTTTVILDGTGTTVQVHGVSSSTIQARGGPKEGLTTAAIDIAKASIPTLIAALVFPDSPEAVIVAGAVLIGHVFPLYHRLVGGYGISPLLGGLVILDWRALAFAIASFALIGLLLGSVYIAIESWPIALIPYFAWQEPGWPLAYALLANVIYWWRSRTEARAALRSFRADHRPWRTRVADFKKYPDYEPPDRAVGTGPDAQPEGPVATSGHR